mmetsp:Transcript_31603/g.38654  ORF Transcript_31603/g.38654 Transcript_31603/m.38654 type:complete len:376 (+) Transcript_31603:85-1212(+)|eukprot:CAMPEP_0172497416 /NCGR_PEP_ID=MMETSP1066-20121228/99560_1 /TAXON_ID=671091 /ORGANISM="Coscinodiscus wailesii, Strain CCMP2513" /LENGTH=375 /DNA_ID=CAMNT_0013270177 /DNA_START=77 /DNA_END=1204 /DNA_ORIENTATION=+
MAERDKINGSLSGRSFRTSITLCVTLLLATTTYLLVTNKPFNQHDQQSFSIRHRQLEQQNAETKRPGSNKSPAVVVLSSNNDEDLAELCLAMKSLLFLRGGHTREWIRSPVLVFNEGDLTAEQMQKVSVCTSRPVAFPVVNLLSFPNGFDPDKEWETFSAWSPFRPVRDRDRWSYAQMIRFWTTLIWNHPAIQQYNVLMRIDTDSCFLWQRDGNLNHQYKMAPGLEGRYVYQSNYENYVGGDTHYIEGLFDFAVKYMEANNLKPQNPTLWGIIRRTWEEQRNLPVFQTNFEITRVSFFQRADVRKWNEALAERPPYGIFRKRWGDAQFRVLTVAMFAKEENLLLSKSTGYLHGRGRCARNFISEIHDRLRTKGTW